MAFRASARTILAASVIGLAGIATTGSAQAVNGAASGLASPTNTITFSELVLPSGTPLLATYAGFGVTFSNMFYDPEPGNPFLTPAAGNFGPASLGYPIFNPIEIMFNAPVSGAVFNMAANGAPPSSFTAFLGATSVASFTSSVPLTTTPWYGFDGVVFDRIEIVPGGVNNAAQFDNIEFETAASGSPTAVTPEPATMTMLAFGLVGIAGLKRRRRA